MLSACNIDKGRNIFLKDKASVYPSERKYWRSGVWRERARVRQRETGQERVREEDRNRDKISERDTDDRSTRGKEIEEQTWDTKQAAERHPEKAEKDRDGRYQKGKVYL